MKLVILLVLAILSWMLLFMGLWYRDKEAILLASILALHVRLFRLEEIQCE